MTVDQQLRRHAPDETTMREESARLRSSVLARAMSGADTTSITLMPRRRRTRSRSVVRWAAVAASLAAVATGASLTLDGGSPASAAQQRFVAAAAAPAYDTYGAFSAGRTVYIGNHQVTFDEKIKAMYYTSEGVLVRTGRVAYTDDSGPSHYELIRPDGTHTGIDLRMGDRVVGTDPQSPDVAYAERTGDRWSLVVVDLVTGDEVARTTIDGAFTWGGWEAPPVTMSGHRMWALLDAGWVEYDWAAGTTRTVPGADGAILAAAHGRFLAATDPETDAVSRDWQVRDLTSGAALRDVRIGADSPSPSISPDGRFVRVQAHYAGFDDDGALVDPPGPYSFIDIGSGAVTAIDEGGPLGWTPGGNTLEVDAKNDRLTVCYPTTGRCDHIDLPISGTGKVKLGGTSYES